MTTHKHVMDLADDAARKCGVGVIFPRHISGLIGHIDFYSSSVTVGGVGDLLKCLAMLGVSRDEWRDGGNTKQAWLRDVDGALLGHVVVCDEGASASLHHALTNTPKCFIAP